MKDLPVQNHEDDDLQRPNGSGVFSSRRVFFGAFGGGDCVFFFFWGGESSVGVRFGVGCDGFLPLTEDG